MKNKLLKVIAVSTIFAFGVGIAANINQSYEPLSAVQHQDNYNTYTYSGSYYSSINSSMTEGLEGTLRKALTTLIFPKAWYTYSGSSNGTLGQILQSADEDPTNNSNMVLLYTRDSIQKSGSTVNGTLIWNREHVWPQNLSNGHWGKEQAGADLLHIRPTYEKTNTARGNTRYGDNNKTGVQKLEGMPYAYTSGGYFEPLDSVKGDVARILMYIYTAYRDYYNDSSLLVTKAIESYDVLLKWHTMDKPDALEGHRNDFCETSIQKNRNPFVDHPEYAWEIFGDSASVDVKEACKNAYPVASQPSGDNSSSLPSATSESQSVNPSTSVVPGSSEQQPAKKKAGCNGSIVAVTSLSGLSALVGLIFVFSKKKK